MKWREPWRETLAAQEPFSILSSKHLKSAAIWMSFFALFGVAGVIAGSTTLSSALSRIWIAVPLGLTVSLAVYINYWLWPATITSGPRGIVRQHGGKLMLIPWGAIVSYDILTSDRTKVLQITMRNGEQHKLLIPPEMPTEDIENELLEKVRAQP